LKNLQNPQESPLKLAIATCQFPIGSDLRANVSYVLAQMRRASARGADVVHFPEAALSGYAGVEFPTFKKYDWAMLESSTRSVMTLAKELGLWTIVGSAHRLSPGHKPHNSLYIIDDRGRLVDRYDKMFCTGDRSEQNGDLKHYCPGSRLCTFTISGVKCGTLICHDFRYQELYREYQKRGVCVVFHSYHNAHMAAGELRKYNIWGEIVPPTMQTYAANNHLWISANNSSRRASCWPSFFVRPDGIITGKLANNRAGVLISSVDTRAKIYDASEAWRDRAVRGVFHSGSLVSDPRSDQRRRL
jgi:predicted amidohydrolase